MSLIRAWSFVAIASLAGAGLAHTAPAYGDGEGDQSEMPRVGSDQVTVQILGRFCTYHRSDVENALRAFKDVERVEFLNNHGTVLVSYQRGSLVPQELAGSVERALAGGWNCKAKIDRGQ